MQQQLLSPCQSVSKHYKNSRSWFQKKMQIMQHKMDNTKKKKKSSKGKIKCAIQMLWGIRTVSQNHYPKSDYAEHKRQNHKNLTPGGKTCWFTVTTRLARRNLRQKRRPTCSHLQVWLHCKHSAVMAQNGHHCFYHIIDCHS